MTLFDINLLILVIFLSEYILQLFHKNEAHQAVIFHFLINFQIQTKYKIFYYSFSASVFTKGLCLEGICTKSKSNGNIVRQDQIITKDKISIEHSVICFIHLVQKIVISCDSIAFVNKYKSVRKNDAPMITSISFEKPEKLSLKY
jgi:hypothetical protein